MCNIASSHRMSNRWVISLTSSRYFFNYRHAVDALAVYELAQLAEIPRSNVLLLDATDVSYDPRNPRRGEMHLEATGLTKNVFRSEFEVDFRGEAVSLSLLRDLFTLDPVIFEQKYGSSAQYLDSSNQSTIILFLSGHGGDEFFKFHDQEELEAAELVAILQSAYRAGKYNDLQVVLDTCQAATLGEQLRLFVPRVSVLVSSQRGENSYAHLSSPIIGLPVSDKFSYYLFHSIRRGVKRWSALQRELIPSLLLSTPSLLLHDSAVVELPLLQVLAPSPIAPATLPIESLLVAPPLSPVHSLNAPSRTAARGERSLPPSLRVAAASDFDNVLLVVLLMWIVWLLRQALN